MEYREKFLYQSMIDKCMMFSDEAILYLKGKIKRHYVEYWVDKNSHLVKDEQLLFKIQK